jgi:hypothetical protein
MKFLVQFILRKVPGESTSALRRRNIKNKNLRSKRKKQKKERYETKRLYYSLSVANHIRSVIKIHSSFEQRDVPTGGTASHLIGEPIVGQPNILSERD